MDTILLKDNAITENTPLGGNIDVDKFRFCINDAQVSKLEEVLGEDLYQKLLDDWDIDSPTYGYAGDYLILYEKYVMPFLIHQATVEYLLVGAYQIGNGGIYKHTPSNGTPIEKNEVDYLVQNQRSKAEIFQQRMEKWLSKNTITEYTSNEDTIVPPNGRSNVGGWYLGD